MGDSESLLQFERDTRDVKHYDVSGGEFRRASHGGLVGMSIVRSLFSGTVSGQCSCCSIFCGSEV